TLEQVVAGILSSPEFLAHAGTLANAPSTPSVNFIESLYILLLGRTASDPEVESWLQALPGTGRSDTAMAFLNSGEFRADFVQALYGFDHSSTAEAEQNLSLTAGSFFSLVPNMLHRLSAPEATEVGTWTNSGLDMLSLEIAFASSNEFFVNG